MVVSVTMLLVSTAAAIYRDGVIRAFYFGFAFFGWSYLFLVFVVSPLGGLGLDSGVGLVFHWLARDVMGLSRFPDQVAVAQVGHHIVAIANGAIGGLVCRYLYLTKQRDP